VTRAVLTALLDRLPRAVDGDSFTDPGAPAARPRVFGGQVMAQAYTVMARTAPPDRPAHSLHVRFVGTVRPDEPLRFDVTRTKEGRSFDLRAVEATQAGRVVLTATASFHQGEPGDSYAPPAGPPSPGPDGLTSWEDRFAGRRDRLSPLWSEPRPVDVRFEEPPPALAAQPRTGQRIWVRAAGPLPDDPVLHTALLVYASDLTLLETAILPQGRVWADGDYEGASLDHTMWLHRPVRLDDWLCFDQQAEWAGGARGLASGRFRTTGGTLVATATQEGLLRPSAGVPAWLR
jgi:acyl-CoA thioesterase II